MIGAFARHAVKKAGLPAELHRTLQGAFDERNAADYGVEFSLSSTETERLIDRVAAFVSAIEKAVGKEAG